MMPALDAPDGDAAAERLVDYWTTQLRDAPSALSLPTDRPRPLKGHGPSAMRPFAMLGPATAALRLLAQRQHTTISVPIAAAFDVLLLRYTAQSDFCIGVLAEAGEEGACTPPSAGRRSLLVVRTLVEASWSFSELVGQVAESTRAARSQEALSFERLVEALVPTCHDGYHPLIQVALSPGTTEAAPQGALVPWRTEVGLDLVLHWIERAGELSFTFEYDAGLFDVATIERMATHFVRLLEAAVAEPERPVGLLPLLSTGERAQALFGWNETVSDYPRDETLDRLFAAQAARTPNAIALRHCDKVTTDLSYASIEARANQLANYLREHGVDTDALVALFLRRSPELLIAQLAVLKAGGAYLPLDCDNPQDRLAYVLDDARPALLLTLSTLMEALPPLGSLQACCLDRDAPAIDAKPRNPPAASSNASSLASVMYTSGSTGAPKGTLVTHRNIVRLVCDNPFFSLAPGARIAQLAPATFDAATFEIWGAWLHGATLVVPAARTLSLSVIGALIEQESIDTLWLTAALFHFMVDYQLPRLARVRHLLAGGDVLSADHVRRFLAAAPGSRLTNGYGPTEATTFSCCKALDDAATLGRSVPIGRPIANTRVYVLDAWLQPVPVGVTGELWIGGDGVARGYLLRPALTAERFLPDPFGTPGARMYRSGDLARRLPDGELEFLGRVDRQVKLHGLRIEPAEIEATVALVSGVAACVVLLREDTPGDKRLVAYVIPRAADVGQSSVDVDTGTLGILIQEHLCSQLPVYMIPGQVVLLDTLPVTANGKLDRKALPAPEDFGDGDSRVLTLELAPR